jgi:alpha-glucosidase
MKIVYVSVFLFLILCSISLIAKETDWILSNPNGTLKFSLQLKDSIIAYQVTALSKGGGEAVVIRLSPLGITRQDQDFTYGLSFVSKSEVSTLNEKYHMIVGKQRDIHNDGKEQIFTFENPNKSKLQLVVRAYADGVAFRYRFPEKS